MTDATKPSDLQSRKTALDMAIGSNMGHFYDTEGKATTNVNKLVDSAKIIETYLKGEK